MYKNPEKQKAATRAWAQKPENKRRAAARMRARRAKFNALVRDHRAGPCVDCGVELPVEVMELDHVRGQKRFQFCHAASFKLEPGEDRVEAILAEIAKCELRCPNCHKMRHYTESNGHFSHRAVPYVYKARAAVE